MDTHDYLRQYVEIRGVEALLLLSADGLMIDSAAREGWRLDEDAFAAVAAQVVTVCHDLGRLLSDELATLTLEYKRWTLVVQALDEVGAYSVLFTEAGANLGMLRMRSRLLHDGLVARITGEDPA